MLAVWRMKMKTDMMTAPTVNWTKWVLNQTAKGNTVAAAREPIDRRRIKNKKTMNASKAARQAKGASTTKHPAHVATPLPPFLNFIKSGYKWPKKAAKATTAGKFSLISGFSQGKIKAR